MTPARGSGFRGRTGDGRMGSRRDRRSLLTALLLAVAGLAAGCADKVAGPVPTVQLRIPGGLKAGAATSFFLTVSAADMDTLRMVLTPSDEYLEARLQIPAGNQRHFLAEARDDSSRVLYRGETVMDIRPVRDLDLAIDMRPVVPMFYLSPHFTRVPMERSFTLEVRAANLPNLNEVELDLAWDQAAPVELDSVTAAPELVARGRDLAADGSAFGIATGEPCVDGDGFGTLAVYHFSSFDGWYGDIYPLQFDLAVTATGGTSVPRAEIHLDRTQIRLFRDRGRAHLYGAAYEDAGHDIVALPSGGYAVAGIASMTVGGRFPRRVPALLRLDSEGQVSWQSEYDRGTPGFAMGVCVDTRGGMLLGGWREGGPDDAGFVLHVDAAGTETWGHDLGSLGTASRVEDVASRPNGGAVAVGRYDRAGEDQPLVVMFGPEGYETELMLPGDPDYADPTHFEQVVVLADRDFTAMGTTAFLNNGHFESRIVLDRFAQDPTLRRVWRRSFADPGGLLAGHGLAVGPDGGYLMVGWITDSGGSRAFVLRTDGQGDELWRFSFGNAWENASCVVAAPGGGFVIAGETRTNWETRQTDIMVVRIDDGGTVVWQRVYGGRGDDLAHAICRRPGGGYLVTGRTDSGSADSYDLFILTLDEAGTKVAGF